MVAVIFDLDGTLIDSAPDIHLAANRVLAEQGLAPMSLPVVRGFIGRGVPHLIGCLLEASGQSPAGPQHGAMVDSFVAGYEDAVGLTVCYPGVEMALDRLAAMGCRMGICTNKPHAATVAVLDHLGLHRHFDTVIGGDSLPLRKPDPSPLLAAAQALGGTGPIYVGDSEVDAETADRAGLRFVLFTEGYRKTPVADLPHDAAFADWFALPGIVAGMA